jgi:hypothetical protein
VATDAGWIGHERQIGTTGVVIRPRLYAAFGVSGATQHTGGLGAPERIVSVNTDAHCPMTAMSSLGIVADARGTLAALADRLGVEVPAEVRDAADLLDAIVVGAGPAGAAAALELARAGRSVVLLERGPFPGAKNVYGGVVYGRVLDDVIPRWWEQVPVQRWVVRRSTMMLTGSQSLSVDFRSEAWGTVPYNGMTVYRPTSTAGWPGMPSPPGPSWSPRPWRPACCATSAAP